MWFKEGYKNCCKTHQWGGGGLFTPSQCLCWELLFYKSHWLATISVCMFLDSILWLRWQELRFLSHRQLQGSCPNIPWWGSTSQKQQGSWLAKPNCYQAQVHSARWTVDQWIKQVRCWGKEGTLIGEPADQEDGRLAPQNNHLLGAWMPGSFIY